MRAFSSRSLARALPWLAALGLGALGVSALFAPAVPDADADVIDPTVQKTIAIGNGGALWPSERGTPQRTGRVVSLPSTPHRKWKRAVGGPLNFPPVVASDGTIVLVGPVNGGTGTEHTLIEFSLADGLTKRTTRLGDVAAATPVLLASGLRVVVSVRDAIGIDAGGVIRFRTPLVGGVATAGKAAIVPLPTGGFTVARAGELIELDSSGAIAGRIKLDLGGSPILAARDNGDVVGVTPNGDLFTWRAGKVPRLVGTFGDKTLPGGGLVCPLGPIVDGVAGSAGPGKRRERVLCALGNDLLVEQIELATGKRSAVFTPPVALLKLRTLLAVGSAGDLAVGTSDGTVSGITSSGLVYGPVDVPGSVSLLSLGKDGGVFGVTAQGEFPPLVADDGAVLFGSTDGVAIAYPTGLVTRITKCSGNTLATVTGVAVAGPQTVLVVCNNGDVELIVEGTPPPPPPPPPAPTNSALVPIPLPSMSGSSTVP